MMRPQRPLYVSIIGFGFKVLNVEKSVHFWFQVRKLCQELLKNYPSEEFVTTTLHTLTQLASATISHLTEHVSRGKMFSMLFFFGL